MEDDRLQAPGAHRATRPWEDPETMLGVDEARQRVLAAVVRLDPVDLPLLDALGLVLAEDVVAADNIPPFRNSAMDGYAVRAQDTIGASWDSPVESTVVAEAAAGHPPEVPVGPSQAVRIMTGAAMPEGADAVVRFEETDERDRTRDPAGSESAGLPQKVAIRRAVKPWENVRDAGEDVRAGSTVLTSGTVLRPAEIGLLASVNRPSARVYRRARVGILSTGDEVIGLGPALLPGQIRDSNSFTLAALVKHCGAEPIMLGVARDTVEDIQHKIRSVPDVDFILTSGGVSLGDYDVVKEVLQAEGEIDLWQVRIKPGKPMAFGRIGGTPLLGLPGNPVAAVVAFLQFGRPAILKMQGHSRWSVPTLKARLLCDHENRGRRRHFVRGVVSREDNEYVVRPSGAQGSGVLSSVARANCFIVLPESWDHAEAGANVDVELFDTEWAM